MRSITSANSQLTLLVAGLFPAPVNIQGYAADDQFTSDSVDTAETVMGVDGIMSAGWVPAIVPLSVMIQADSPSIDLFVQWDEAQRVAREIIFGQATLLIPAMEKSYILTKGVLRQVKRIADGKRTIQPLPYLLHWGSVVATPFIPG